MIIYRPWRTNDKAWRTGRWWQRKNWSAPRKTCPSATLFTADPTQTGMGLNPGFCDKGQANNRLNHGRTHSLLTSAPDRGERAAPSPGHFTPHERAHGTQWMEDQESPKAVLDILEKGVCNQTMIPQMSGP